MKLNNKGFAISTIMYIILIMAVVIIILTLSLLSNRKLVLDKIKSEVKGNLYKEKSCNVLSGNLDTVGSKISCGGENFYVISSSSSDVTVLTENYIEITTENPKQTTDSLQTTYFAKVYKQTQESYNTGYFDESNECSLEDMEDGANLCRAYWLDASGYVYNEKSNFYKYVEAYRDVLESKGVLVNNAKVMSLDEFEKLRDGVCSSGCEWLYSYEYALGSVTPNNSLYRVSTYWDNKLANSPVNQGHQRIRPVITISKASIKS